MEGTYSIPGYARSTVYSLLKEVNFGMMDASGGVLEALETYLSSTLIPALKAQSPDVRLSCHIHRNYYIHSNV